MSYVSLVNGDTNATLRAKINTAFNSIDLIDTATRQTTAKKTASSITTQNLFTVSGGAVRILSIVGHITTAIQASGNNTKLVYTSTGGAAVDLCAVLDVTGSAIRKLLTITGVAAEAMSLSAAEGIVVDAVALKPIRIVPGIISLNCAATTTGVVDWYIEYKPLAIGAIIT